ncbi:MAG: glycosyltransferase 87 family protein [Oscillospiraceae bacterium]
MFAVEKKFAAWVQRNILWMGFIVLLMASLMLRYFLRGFLAGDMEVYLVPWFQTLKQQGLRAAMHLPNNNYNVAYFCLLLLTSWLPFTEIVCVKLVSIVFDYLAAVAMAWGVLQLLPKEDENRKWIAAGTFLGTVLLPIPLANSAVWGQCDVIYTFFLLMCLVLLLKEKYPPAFTMFALALSFKLQAIFFLPVLVLLYFVKKKFSALHFLQIPVFVFLFGLIGRNKGDSIFYGFTVYLNQTQDYKRLYVDYSNIFTAFGDGDFDAFAPPAIIFALAVFAAMLVYVLYKKLNIEGDTLVLLAVWCIMTCTMFLPAMHDRYGFAAELFIWLFFMAKPSLKRFALAIAINFIPVVVYVRAFLERGYLEQMTMSLVNVLVYLAVSVATVLYLKRSSCKLGQAGLPEAACR